MDFTDTQHNLSELVFQGSEELDPTENCPEEVIEALAQWQDRPDHCKSGADILHIEGCPAFSISYQGDARNYWPTEADNDLSETFVRSFLFDHGICNIADERVRLLHVRYAMMAMTGDEYVLVCPYLTEAQNISGINVVCVTKKISRQAN